MAMKATDTRAPSLQADGSLSPERQEIVSIQLDDLQSEMEAGARTVTTIADGVTEMREELLARHLKQARITGALARRVQQLQESIREQQQMVEDLRRTLRDKRR
jgi:predicted RNase H-like nuclease (RuvC/YqgF family)